MDYLLGTRKERPTELLIEIMVLRYKKTPQAAGLVACSLLFGPAILAEVLASAFVLPSSPACASSSSTSLIPSSPASTRCHTSSSTSSKQTAVLLEMAKDSDGPIFYNDFEDFENEEEAKQNDDALRKILSSSSNTNNSKNQLSGDDIVVQGEDDTAASDFSNFLQERSSSANIDWTAIQTRQFSLGQDLILSNYVGNMGFDEVTDWEYYLQSEDDVEEREVVQPNPFDPSKYVV